MTGASALVELQHTVELFGMIFVVKSWPMVVVFSVQVVDRWRDNCVAAGKRNLRARLIPSCRPRCCAGLNLAEILQHRVDHLKGLVNLLAHLGAGEDDLTAHENEKHDLRLDHTVDETGEQLGFVGAEVVMLGSETLETDRELDVARADNVLDLKVGELGVEAKLLDDASVLARRKLRVILRLCAGDDHLAAGEDEGRGLGLANAHDNSSETLRVVLFLVRTAWQKTVEDKHREQRCFSLENNAPGP
jgi:hypothetical protein